MKKKEDFLTVSYSKGTNFREWAVLNCFRDNLILQMVSNYWILRKLFSTKIIFLAE